MDQRFAQIKDLARTHLSEIPSPVRHCISVLTSDGQFQRDQLKTPFPTPGFLLNPLTSVIHFPPYFSDLYAFICDLHSVDKKLATNPASQPLIKEKVQIMQNCIETMSQNKHEQSMLLVLPYVEEIFADDKFAIHAIWTLFSPLTLNLNVQQTIKSCLPPLLKLYNVDVTSLKHMKYYHRSFLIQLMMRLGLQTFLQHFSTLLVEAVSGYHDYIPQNNESPNLYGEDLASRLAKDNDLVQSNPSMCESAEQIDGAVRSRPKPRRTSENSNGGDIESDSENELLKSLGKASIRAKLISKRESVTESENSDEVRSLTRKTSTGSYISETSQDSSDKKDDSEMQESRSRHSSGGSSTSETRSHSPSKISNSSATSRDRTTTGTLFEDTMEEMLHRGGEANICDVASESIRWLAHRLGPVLTAKYLSGNLLRMLTLCYLGEEQLLTVTLQSDVLSASNRGVAGDWNASKILMCLGDIAVLYGEQIIHLQYFKNIVNLINSTQQKVNPRSEAGLVSCASLIHHILPFLSDSELMNCLQETVFQEMIVPMIERASAARLSFPSGYQARAVIMYKIIDILYLIGLRLGFELSRKLLGGIMKRLFSSFDTIYKGTSMVPEVSGSPVHSIKIRNDLSRSESEEAFLDIKMDSGTHEYTIGTPVRLDSLRSLSESTGSGKFRTHSLSPAQEEEDHTLPVGNKEQILEELRVVFSPEMANTAYVAFCKIVGNIYVDELMKNNELIHRLCESYEEMSASEMQPSNGPLNGDDSELYESPETDKRTSWFLPVPKSDTTATEDETPDEEVSGSFGRNVMRIGNRIALSEEPQRKVNDVHQMDTSRLKSPEMERNKRRHLRGNWLAYWEHETGLSERETSVNFKQIKLQSFTDHTSSVRAIHVMDNENSFISASKDKTVKLWSLRSMGDGSARCQSQWSYPYHKKSVFSVTFLESVGIAASCDSSLHLWNPFVGACLRQFDSSRHSPVTVITALPQPSYNLIAGTTDATVRFVDVREKEYVHEFRCTTSQAGFIRCLSVSPNGHWVGVGYSSGIISVLDVRTGLVIGVWKGHDNEILQLHAFDNNRFLTSSFDGQMIMWSADDHKQLSAFKGQTDPVHCFQFYRNEIVSITTGNRVGVHTDVCQSNASFSSTKLRSDTFKGVLTTMAVLPLNRMLLLGADNGSIKLLC